MHVVLMHTLRVRWLPEPVRAAVDASHTSTSLLFILSGFVLAYVYTGGDGRLRVPAREFWAARAARVLPLLWVSHAVALPLLVAREGWGGAGLPSLAAFAGVQAWFPELAHALNTPGWAFSVLLAGYALFPAVVAGMRKLPRRALVPAMAAAWAAAVLPGVVYLAAVPPTPMGERVLYTFPLLRLPEFVFGALLGAWWLGRRAGAGAPVWVAPAALAAWAAAVAWGTGVVPEAVFHNGFLAPVQAALIVGLASGRGGVARLLASRPARRLGDAALALFLLHIPLFSWLLVLGALPRASFAVDAGVYVAFLAGTILLSILVTDRFVTPVAARLKGWLLAVSGPAADAQPVQPRLRPPGLPSFRRRPRRKQRSRDA